MKKYKIPFIIFIIVTVCVVGLVAYIILNPAVQCPEGYTQAQIDAGGCIIGADMRGVGIIIVGFLWLVITGVLGLLVALDLFLKARRAKR